jgi:hypothetical protein
MLQFLALLGALTASPQADRLAGYIVTRQRAAKPYAPLLARRILAEGKAHGIRPAALAAVAYVESRFQRWVTSKTGDRGIFQLRTTDYRIPVAWLRLRAAGLTPGYPDAPWRRVPVRAKWRALRDIRISTALAAAELAGVRAWCRRAGHRVSSWRKGAHRHWIDRYGHHQTGPRWPLGYYVRMLRREYQRIRRVLRTRPRAR